MYNYWWHIPCDLDHESHSAQTEDDISKFLEGLKSPEKMDVMYIPGSL